MDDISNMINIFNACQKIGNNLLKYQPSDAKTYVKEIWK